MKLFNRVKDYVSMLKIQAMQSQIDQQKADLDYVAMMADIEMPDEDTEEAGVDE